MRQKDVVAAKQRVEDFLRRNNRSQIYGAVNQRNWGLYVNCTNRFISLHGPGSPDWQRAQRNRSTSISNVYNCSPNGFWIGPFPDFSVAYSFAELLRRALYLQTHEEMTLIASKGVHLQPMKLF